MYPISKHKAQNATTFSRDTHIKLQSIWLVPDQCDQLIQTLTVQATGKQGQLQGASPKPQASDSVQDDYRQH